MQQIPAPEPDELGPGIEIVELPDDVAPLDVAPPGRMSPLEPLEPLDEEGDALADWLAERLELDELGVGGGPLDAEFEPDELGVADALPDAAERLDEPPPPPPSGQQFPPVKTGRPLR